ncbi:MAG TPA: mechanosensitive ion channel [Bacteroidetes bacterium]|nr:mechanosensitive ion channel [Bacteroidota bacterium]
MKYPVFFMLLVMFFSLGPATGQSPGDTLTIRGIVIIPDSSEQDATPADTLANAGSRGEQKGDAVDINSIRNFISFPKIFWTVIILLVGYLVIKGISTILDIIAERSTRVRLTIKGIIPVFRMVTWTLIIYIIIQGIFSPSWEVILALGASIGVAVGFAAQDILKNIFGGITILAEKPFQVGDKIQVGNHYGEVRHIGFRSTRIVTPDDSTVSIPNAQAVSQMVSNANSGESNCQVVAEVFLPPHTDTGVVRQIALEAAQVSGYVYLNKPITVLFEEELSEKRLFLKMRLKAYVLDIRYEFIFKSDMTERVLKELYNRQIIPEETAYQNDE